MHKNILYAAPKPALSATRYFRYLMHLYQANYILFQAMETDAGAKTASAQKDHYRLWLRAPQKTPYTETFDFVCAFQDAKMRKPLPLLQLKVRAYHDAGQMEVLPPWPAAIRTGRPAPAQRFLPPMPRRHSALAEKWAANSALSRALKYFG